MPLSRNVARFNRRYLNRVALTVAGHLPGFAVVSHVGRRSGRTYRTPVNAFRADGGYIIALTYGAESDWVRNVLAAGWCELYTRGKRARLRDPRVLSDERRGWAPLPVRLALGLVRAHQYVRLSTSCPS
ncbi:MAG: nitroreductase family deazaflavin-dependent oxidoreductase [Chloroflexota bacterium]|nr:nitroreductase family deazaflavin-dependent oxidoreductase [Chloroflexota bacterium]